jgi:hypothetical protein
MVRTWSLVLGLGLVILGLGGLSQLTGGTWMAWLDIIVGLVSFFAAGSSAMAPATEGGRQPAGSGGLLTLSVFLFAMWLIGLVTGSVAKSILWWNFAFACAYGLVAIAAYARRGLVMKRPTVTTSGQEGPKKAA